MAPGQQKLDRAKISVVVALTFVARDVDVLGWLTLDRVFIARMNGNAVQLAVGARLDGATIHLSVGTEHK